MSRSLLWPVLLLAVTRSLAATFVFDNAAEGYDGQVTDTLTVSGIVMTVTAALESGSTNSTALLAANNSGDYIGVQSSADPAEGSNQRPRINNEIDELLLVSFNHTVEITQIVLRSFSANNNGEEMRMRLESGTDPFSGLSGYSGDYSILTSPTPRLKYSSSSGINGANTVPIGMGGQDPLVVQSNTVVSFSSTKSKTVDGGFMLESITVREPGNDERPPASTGPNIIMVLADDLGWTDISAGGPNMGNQSGYYETPNIERLAREGMSFTSCYVQPNCSPSRAALLSGQYAPRTGNGVYVVSSLNRGNETPDLKGPSQNEDVPGAAINVAESLQAAGYVTAHFGKYHVGGHEGGTTTLPLNQGFDYNYGGGSAGSPGDYRPSDSSGSWKYGSKVGPELDAYAAPYTQQYVDDVLKPYDHGSNVDSIVGEKKFLTDAMGDAIVDFMDRHRGGSMSNYPFYVQFHTYAVHTPTQSRPDLKTYYQGRPAAGGHDNATYAGLVEGMDQAVGRILDYLSDPNGDGNGSDSTATNTLVVFCSDNGGHIGPTDNAPLRGRKGMFYEGGIRVPLICRWAGRIPTNVTSDTPVHAVDFYPTFLELAGGAPPDPAGHPLDGLSFAAHLQNPGMARNREPIVYHFPGYLDNRARPCSLAIGDVNGKRYKLMYTYDMNYTIKDNNGSAINVDDPWELYCLSDDIGETHDLLDGDYWKWIVHAGTASNLAAAINTWHTQDDPTWSPVYPQVRATGQVLTEPPATVDPVEVPEDQQFCIQALERDPPSGALNLKWRSAPGLSFGIEGSSDLSTWIRLTNGIMSQGTQTSHSFNDPEGTSAAERYYRPFLE